MVYYKVVTEDLRSIGLRGAPQIQYKIGEWVYPLEPLSMHYFKGGGLWVYSKRSDALNGKRYVEKKHRIKCRIFFCRIGIILTHTPETFHRVKTNKVMLLQELQKAVSQSPLFSYLRTRLGPQRRPLAGTKYLIIPPVILGVVLLQ